jgi:hypothetical protein
MVGGSSPNDHQARVPLDYAIQAISIDRIVSIKTNYYRNIVAAYPHLYTYIAWQEYASEAETSWANRCEEQRRD